MSDTDQSQEYILIRKLESCEGYRDWLVPRMRKRMEELAKTCVEEHWKPEETAKLRWEYEFLRDWLSKPAAIRAMHEAAAADRG
jgi:hypothetical protein